jgi:hypothetical protein
MIILPDDFTDDERELVPEVLEHLRDARDRVEQKFLDEVEEVFARPKPEPLLSGFQAHEEIGMGVINPGGVKRAEKGTWGKSIVSRVLETQQKLETMQKLYEDGLISQQSFLDMAGLPTPDHHTFQQEILGEFQPREDTVFDESDVVRRSSEACGVRGSASHRSPMPGRLRSRHGNLGSQEAAPDAQPVQSVPRFRSREET